MPDSRLQASALGDQQSTLYIGVKAYRKGDYGEAIRWFVRALSPNGFVPAGYWLGQCYYYGHGCRQDKPMAAKLYEGCAELGCVESQASLGTMYCGGDGVQANKARALHWTRKAACQDHLVSCYNMFCFLNYEQNENLHRRDLSDAAGFTDEAEQAAFTEKMHWLHIAADRGLQPALDSIKQLPSGQSWPAYTATHAIVVPTVDDMRLAYAPEEELGSAENLHRVAEAAGLSFSGESTTSLVHGAKVEANGLLNHDEVHLNGAHGVIWREGPCQDGALLVLFDGMNKPVPVRRGHLRVVQNEDPRGAHAPERSIAPGDRVEVAGLIKADSLNGRRGFVQTAGRLAGGRLPVLLDGLDTPKAIRKSNLLSVKVDAKVQARLNSTEWGPGLLADATGLGALVYIDSDRCRHRQRGGPRFVLRFLTWDRGPQKARSSSASAVETAAAEWGVRMVAVIDDAAEVDTAAPQGFPVLDQGVARAASFEDFSPRWQFILSCGFLPDLDRLHRLRPAIVRLIRDSPNQRLCLAADVPAHIKIPGVGMTVLEQACRKGHIAIARFLIDFGGGMVSPPSPGTPWPCPLAWACYTNKLELIKILIRCGAEPAGVEESFGMPATHIAAMNGSLHCVQYLIDKLGQDPLRLDVHGRTVLACTGECTALGLEETAQWLRQRKFPTQRFTS